MGPSNKDDCVIMKHDAIDGQKRSLIHTSAG
jgi:hypothetical protein